MNEELKIIMEHIEAAKAMDLNYIYSHKISRSNKRKLSSSGYKFSKFPFVNRLAGRFTHYTISW